MGQTNQIIVLTVVSILSAIIGGVVVYMITEGKLPAILTGSTIATSTPNIADLFYRLNQIDRPIDQREFFHQHERARIVGTGSYITLGGSREEKRYRLYLSIRTGILSSEYIACSLADVDESIERRIDLLKEGQKVDFTGTFSNSSEFGSNAWVVDDCRLL